MARGSGAGGRRDHPALSHLRAADPVLGGVIERVGHYDLVPRVAGSHFEAVVRAIVGQQLSVKAAAAIYSRLVEAAGRGGVTPRALLRLTDGKMRAIGLSRGKIGYLRELAERARRRSFRIERLHELDDDAVIAALTSVKGIGRWTAHMFLIFRLGRLDVLPELDLGIRKAIQRAYRMRRLPDTKRVARVGARWAPYRSVASWYLWRSLELD